METIRRQEMNPAYQSENLTLYVGDCLDLLRTLPDASVDLVFCSPPYEAARTYGVGFDLRGQAWVDWSAERFCECCRVCRGLVAWVVEGQTRRFQWSATPALLMADLHRSGIKLRKPPIFQRVGIPGSGGPDWWRNDYEFVICATPGKLPWSDNTATGHAPKYPPGGNPSNRQRNGERVNVSIDGRKYGPRLQREGDTRRKRTYKPPAKSNPGNVIRCHGGGGHLGNPLAHENEAPFPESLALPFVLSFCPPGGVALDPFNGSGTTAAVALANGRRAIGCDVRQSQIELTLRRLGLNQSAQSAATGLESSSDGAHPNRIAAQIP
jgi:hypothetical protein